MAKSVESKIRTKDGIYTAIIFRIVGDLSVFSKYDFTTCCDETKLRNIHFDDSTLSHDPQLSVHGRLRVLFNAENGELECSF